MLNASGLTAEIERLFNFSKMILSDKRLQMGDKQFESHMICKINANLMQVVIMK